jgi:hypothetical protein
MLLPNGHGFTACGKRHGRKGTALAVPQGAEKDLGFRVFVRTGFQGFPFHGLGCLISPDLL